MRLVPLFLVAAALGGCKPTDAPPTAHHSPQRTAEVVPPSPSNPLADAAQPDASERTFGGVVAERLRAGGYSYVRVDGDDAQRWVATMGEAPPLLAAVRVKTYGASDDFHSRRLDRDFSRLLFGTVQPLPSPEDPACAPSRFVLHHR